LRFFHQQLKTIVSGLSTNRESLPFLPENHCQKWDSAETLLFMLIDVVVLAFTLKHPLYTLDALVVQDHCSNCFPFLRLVMGPGLRSNPNMHRAQVAP